MKLTLQSWPIRLLLWVGAFDTEDVVHGFRKVPKTLCHLVRKLVAYALVWIGILAWLLFLTIPVLVFIYAAVFDHATLALTFQDGSLWKDENFFQHCIVIGFMEFMCTAVLTAIWLIKTVFIRSERYFNKKRRERNDRDYKIACGLAEPQPAVIATFFRDLHDKVCTKIEIEVPKEIKRAYMSQYDLDAEEGSIP